MHGDRADPRAGRPDYPTQPTVIGPIVVDWGRLTVLRDGAQARITPKAAEVLRLLLGHPNETVSRARILEHAWPGTFSSDEVLTQVVAELRRVLGDSAREPQLIATVPKLGYRWVGPMAATPADHAAAPAPATSSTTGNAPTADRARRLSITGGAMLLVAAIVTGFFAMRGAWREDSQAGPGAPGSSISAPAKPVTFEPGRDLDPDLDRDGRRVAYVHGSSFDVELRVRTLGESAYQRIETGDDGMVSAPAWSPDGRSIAYIWHGDGRCELRRVIPDSGRVDTIAGGCPATIPSSADWSPDGAWLVFSRSVAGAVAMDTHHVAAHLVRPDGSGLQPLSQASRRLIADVHPRFSPDGRRVAFVRDGDGRNRVLVSDVDSAAAAVEIAVGLWPYRVEWAGDDALLVAGHGRTAAEIWLVSLVGAPRRAVALDSAGPGMSVDAAGQVLVHERRTVDDNIWSVALDGAAAPERVTGDTRSELCPRVSPDGARLAYLSDQSGGLELHVRDMASGAQRKLTSFAPGSALDLNWSPSGLHLVTIVGTLAGKRPALVAADGSPVELPPAIAALRVAQADWSGNGRYLLLAVEDEGRRELRRVPFPDLSADEPLADAAIAAFVPADDSGDVWMTRSGAGALERLVAATGQIETTALRVDAAPADQWLVRDGFLVEMVQIERSTGVELRARQLDGSPIGHWRIAAPQPPLGRNFDVRNGRIWFAQRDLDEVDLVSVDLPEH